MNMWKNPAYLAGMEDGFASGEWQGYRLGYGFGEKNGFRSGWNTGQPFHFEDGYNAGWGDCRNADMAIAGAVAATLIAIGTGAYLLYHRFTPAGRFRREYTHLPELNHALEAYYSHRNPEPIRAVIVRLESYLMIDGADKYKKDLILFLKSTLAILDEQGWDSPDHQYLVEAMKTVHEGLS